MSILGDTGRYVVGVIREDTMLAESNFFLDFKLALPGEVDADMVS